MNIGRRSWVSVAEEHAVLLPLLEEDGEQGNTSRYKLPGQAGDVARRRRVEMDSRTMCIQYSRTYVKDLLAVQSSPPLGLGRRLIALVVHDLRAPVVRVGHGFIWLVCRQCFMGIFTSSSAEYTRWSANGLLYTSTRSPQRRVGI